MQPDEYAVRLTLSSAPVFVTLLDATVLFVEGVDDWYGLASQPLESELPFVTFGYLFVPPSNQSTFAKVIPLPETANAFVVEA